MGVTKLTSASGILALLDEPEPELKIFALERLYDIIDVFWPEIADYVQKIEALEESKDFSKRQLAALIVSKVYFHLGSYSDSLNYALRTGVLLAKDDNELYINTVKEHAVDHYVEASRKMLPVDPKLEALINGLFEHSLSERQYKHAIGISMETQRMDWFQKAISASDDRVASMNYAYRMAMQYVVQKSFRDQVLKELVDLYQRDTGRPDYVNMCQCLIHLDKPTELASLLSKLIQNDMLKTDTMDNELMAYQIGFDLYDSANQDLLWQVQEELRLSAPIPSLITIIETRKPIAPENEEEDQMEVETNIDEAMSKEEVKVEVKEENESSSERKLEDLTENENKHQCRITRLMGILQGTETINLNLQFLISNNQADLLILKQTKDSVRASVCHTATVIANGFMHCGTTSDVFLRDNLDWLSRATNWAKMTATASLGVVHRGHEKEPLTLMQAYLPRDSNSPGYVESGSLYALGLIHANHGGAITDYLLQQTRDTNSHVVRHGGCLGLGLAALGTRRLDIYEMLYKCLLGEDAVTGEGAALATGLVMLGSNNTRIIREMVDHARDTAHEKILRGIAAGVALIMYGQTDEAEPLIQELEKDKNALLRRCGMYCLGLAYCGTAATQPMKRLLHVAVSDVDNDVRRAAVEALGFLMFRCPDQVPSMVSLLAESYNPHVRSGAALALGISCAGTGHKEALSLLEPLTNDPVNFVRQSALLAAAMVLIQHTDATCSRTKEFRTLFAKVISDKHEDSIAKFGAILAQGIVDAGGRNMTLSLQSRTGHTNMLAVVGMFVFTQFWYWFPLSHFLSLAFTPTSVIGLNNELKMPKMSFISGAKPSTYGYPPAMEEKKKEVAEKVTAVLSMTAKAKKKREQKEEKMDVDEDSKEAKKKEKEDKKKKDDDKKKEEPAFDTLSNPARVMKQQLKVMKMPENARYTPVKELTTGGIIMMRDGDPETSEDLVVPVSAMGPNGDEEKEPQPPEPFEFTE